MQFLIDHTAAVVIGAVILFAVFALGKRSQDSAIEATKVDLGKAELRQLIDVLEQDLNNMGSGMANPNASISSYNTVSGYDELRFRGLQDDTATPNPMPEAVTYRWRQQGTATLPDGSVVDTYEVERSTAGGGTMTFDRAAPFALTLRKDELAAVPLGSIADSLALVRYVDVEVGMVAPLGTENLLQQTRWTKRFRPINLDAQSRQLIAAKP